MAEHPRNQSMITGVIVAPLAASGTFHRTLNCLYRQTPAPLVQLAHEQDRIQSEPLPQEQVARTA